MYSLDKAIARGLRVHTRKRKYKLKPRFFILLAIFIGFLVYIIVTIFINCAPESLVTSAYWREVFHP
jgi:hypothetical protein